MFVFRNHQKQYGRDNGQNPGCSEAEIKEINFTLRVWEEAHCEKKEIKEKRKKKE